VLGHETGTWDVERMCVELGMALLWCHALVMGQDEGKGPCGLFLAYQRILHGSSGQRGSVSGCPGIGCWLQRGFEVGLPDLVLFSHVGTSRMTNQYVLLSTHTRAFPFLPFLS
jgi:hypothetical protein